MIQHREEKQVAIRLNDSMIGRLDALARNGAMNRTHLMLSFINIWLNVLENSSLPGLFYIANLFRVREMQMKVGHAYEHEFTESRIPEKPLPLKFEKSTTLAIAGQACVNHISRHQLLKVMIIVGIEELEELTQRKSFDIGEIEPKLCKSFSKIMDKGFKAFKAYLR